jgi:hypothetical protein
MANAILKLEEKTEQLEWSEKMEIRGEVVLIRGSRAELFSDLDAVATFLENRRAQRKSPVVREAERIIQEAA